MVVGIGNIWGGTVVQSIGNSRGYRKGNMRHPGIVRDKKITRDKIQGIGDIPGYGAGNRRKPGTYYREEEILRDSVQGIEYIQRKPALNI
jgi:hypothetical protein